MNKKILLLAIALIISVLAFSACSSDEGVPATQISDGDSALIGEEFSNINEQLQSADSAETAASTDDFGKLISSSDTDSVSYEGKENITIAQSEHTDKTVVIDTEGSVTVDSTVNSIVLSGAANGITLNAKVDSLLIDGTDITTDIYSETGNVYIRGKNAVVNLHANASKILVQNATAVINNLTDETIFVTLVNGTKIQLNAKHTYLTDGNLIRKYS